MFDVTFVWAPECSNASVSTMRTIGSESETNSPDSPDLSFASSDRDNSSRSRTLHAQVADRSPFEWSIGSSRDCSLLFYQFLRRWKLPTSLMQYWQGFLRQIYFDCPDSQWTPDIVLKTKRKCQHFVISPAGQYPDTATFHFPAQWHYLPCMIFLDTSVFQRCPHFLHILISK